MNYNYITHLNSEYPYIHSWYSHALPFEGGDDLMKLRREENSIETKSLRGKIEWKSCNFTLS